MIQRIQTVFWFIAIAITISYLFQTYDSDMGFRNYQEPLFSAISGLSIITLCLSIFSFHRRKRQLFFSNLSAILILTHIGILIYNHIRHDMMQYLISFILLSLAFISNICGTISTSRDLKLLENSSRLR